MIRDLQARSGARIDVDQNVPQGQPRVITYRGTRETVDFAKHLVHMLSVQGVHENDLPLGNASQELLIIPSMSVGKVIGRGKFCLSDGSTGIRSSPLALPSNRSHDLSQVEK